MSVPKNINESKYLDHGQDTTCDKNTKDQISSVRERASSRESDEEDQKEQPGSPPQSSQPCDNCLSTMLSEISVQEKGCFQDINLYKIFKGNRLPYLWKLWELVLTNQPLMVFADLPSECRYRSVVS